jgi:glycosyltransferase involved in cell wall biosynthesis
MKKLMTISIVIPAYNSSQSLIDLVNIIEQLRINEKFEICEVIFVDDASTDSKTFSTIVELADQFKWVKGIRLSRNFGQYAATICGLNHSTGDYVVTMDDDLQHHPSDIKNLLERSNHDVVIGYRRNRKSPFLDRFTSLIRNHFDTILLGKPPKTEMSAFRLIKRYVVDEICKMQNINPYLNALILYVTKDIVNVDVHHFPRSYGKSGYSITKRLALFSHLFFGNSGVFMRFLRDAGIIVFTISFILAIVVVAKKLFLGVGVTGWTSIMLIILFFGSLQMIAISLIAEFLQRMFTQVESKKIFIEREKINIS